MSAFPGVRAENGYAYYGAWRDEVRLRFSLSKHPCQVPLPNVRREDGFYRISILPFLPEMQEKKAHERWHLALLKGYQTWLFRMAAVTNPCKPNGFSEVLFITTANHEAPP